MRISRALLLCNSCRSWSGWISRTKGGVKRIDTRCSVCGARLKGTPDYFRDTKRQYRHAYAPGRGAHNRGQSIKRMQVFDGNEPVKKMASERNRSQRRVLMGREGFETAKNRQKREKEEQDKRARRG
jgi:hypothetical protein